MDFVAGACSNVGYRARTLRSSSMGCQWGSANKKKKRAGSKEESTGRRYNRRGRSIRTPEDSQGVPFDHLSPALGVAETAYSMSWWVAHSSCHTCRQYVMDVYHCRLDVYHCTFVCLWYVLGAILMMVKKGCHHLSARWRSSVLVSPCKVIKQCLYFVLPGDKEAFLSPCMQTINTIKPHGAEKGHTSFLTFAKRGHRKMVRWWGRDLCFANFWQTCVWKGSDYLESRSEMYFNIAPSGSGAAEIQPCIAFIILISHSVAEHHALVAPNLLHVLDPWGSWSFRGLILERLDPAGLWSLREILQFAFERDSHSRFQSGHDPLRYHWYSSNIVTLVEIDRCEYIRDTEIDDFSIPFYFTVMQMRMDLESRWVKKTSKYLGVCRNERWHLAIRLIPESRHWVKGMSLGSWGRIVWCVQEKFRESQGFIVSLLTLYQEFESPTSVSS